MFLQEFYNCFCQSCSYFLTWLCKKTSMFLKIYFKIYAFQPHLIEYISFCTKLFCFTSEGQNLPSRGDLRKRYSEITQQIYRRIPVPKCDLNKIVLQLHWNRTSSWVFSCKFAAYFQNTFLQKHLCRAASRMLILHLVKEVMSRYWSFACRSNSLW